MNKNLLFLVAAIGLLLIPGVLGYQQSSLVFQLDGAWQPFDHRHSAQSFQKQDVWLEVRSLSPKAKLASPSEIGYQIGANVTEGRLVNGINETTLVGAEKIYVVAHLTHASGTYLFSLSAPKAKPQTAKNEMEALYKTFSWATDQKFSDAPWEEKLLDPEPLPFFTAHPVPWGKLIALAVVVFFIWRFIRRRRKGKEGKSEKEKPGDGAKPKAEKSS